MDGKDVLAVHGKDLVAQIEGLVRVLLKEVESDAVAAEETHLATVGLGFDDAATVEVKRVLVPLVLHCALKTLQQMSINGCRVSRFQYQGRRSRNRT